MDILGWRRQDNVYLVELGGWSDHLLARIYIQVGELEKALDLLEPLLKEPYLSPGRLRIDPAFAPPSGATRASSGW